MAFSLSPSVDIREYDLTLSVPNLPSAKTGMVIRSDKGESLKIQSITSERDLVKAFGEPTAYNYQDWYNAWNFLQYASSLYMVRAMDDSVENAGIEVTTNATNPLLVDVEQLTQENLYNPDKAELTLETEVTPEGIRFYNKEIQHSQNYAVAICMNNSEWKRPFSADGFDLLHTLTSTSAFEDDGSTPATSTVIPFSNNSMIVGDTFEFDGHSYTVTIVDDVANTVEVEPQLVAGDGLTQITFTSDMVPEVKSYREETFSSDLVNSDGSLVSFDKFFEYPPEFVKGEFAIVVLEKDEDGKYDNIEEFIVSKKESGRDSEGRNVFVDEVFFKKSNLLYAKYNVDYTTDLNTSDSPLVKLEGTTITLEATEPVWLYPRKKQFLTDLTTFDKWIYDPIGYKQSDVMAAGDEFADPESFDVNLLVSHQLDMNRASTIAASRKDCLAIVAPYDYISLVGKSATEASQWLIEEYGSQTYPIAATFNTFNSYSAIYGNMKYQYDKFNDVNRWLCIAGDIAGLAAQTDANRDPWWAFAGLERGKIRNSIKPAFNPNKQNRDDLYINSINPVMSVPGEGVMIVWGQKTSLAKPSAFDRVNVRRLLITLEKAIATASRYALFEFNDEFTRARLRGLIEPFLRDVKGRRGIYDFLVVIDSSNNTAEVIDKNALIIDVYIKPTKVAEFIQINMNVTRTDANFQELIGR